MKQQVPSSNSHGSSNHSAAMQTRASRAPTPKVRQPPATPGPGVKARPRPAAAATTLAATRRQPAAVPVPVPVRRVMTPVPVRRVMTGTKESETVEEEVVRLREEVDALRREVQRLLRLNAELQQQPHNAATNNKPQPPSKIPISGGVVVAPPPPPPPPPLPRHQNQRVHSAPSTNPVSKATALVDMYNSLQISNKPSKHTDKGDKSRSHHHHSSIVDELQNRSRHLLAIKEDVETKAEFVNHLINKIHTSTYTGVEQVLSFVDWLDQQLSTLSDETAVLKHFNWPERKADALREAASEYRHLKCLLTEISSLRDGEDGGIEVTATLRKISSLLDKLEKSMDRLVNLRRSVIPSYKELRIPTDWMLDSGMVSKMRLASVSLAKMYTKTVLKELNCRDTAGTGNEAALVAQSVRFTYRVHQFAGGLDCEAMHAFEELRRRVQLVSQ